MSDIKKTFKILSIDGGGIKGLYSLYVLKHIEEYFCKSGTLCDYFNMLCGTSTGAIIILAISLRIPITKIIEMYETNANIIFPGKNYNEYVQPFVNLLYGIYQLTGSKYSNEELKHKLSDFFDKKTTNDLDNIICIPSYNITTKTNVVFTNNKQLLLSDIAIATSSAPTYFAPYYIPNEGYFVDGGLWANNPVLVGIDEYMKKYRNTYDDFDILSIGNINTNTTFNPDIKYDSTYWNVFNFDKLISLFYDSDYNSDTDVSLTLCKQMNSHMTRIECNSYHDDQSIVKMDNSNKSFLALLKKLGDKDGILAKDNKYDIKRFFEKVKS